LVCLFFFFFFLTANFGEKVVLASKNVALKLDIGLF